MKAFEDSQESSVEALRQLEKLAKEGIDAEKERQQIGLDADTFTIYWELKREGVEDAKALAKNLKALFDRFPDYRYNAEELRQLKAEIYKLLLAAWKANKWSRSRRNYWVSSEADAMRAKRKTIAKRVRIESGCHELGCKDQREPKTNPSSTNVPEMGFMLEQRPHHIQLRTLRSTLSFSGIRYRSRASAPQNPESQQTL